MFQYNPCYCLSGCKKIFAMYLNVSIQPLLLFIHISRYTNGNYSRFQYNPCYCLSAVKACIKYNKKGFNTTLGTVYRSSKASGYGERDVSIQPLLLFIQIILCDCTFCPGFNTTLVTVYLPHPESTGMYRRVSIQPLLLFIFHRRLLRAHSVLVSIQPLLLFILLFRQDSALFSFVSIQPLLLFILQSKHRRILRCGVSIQPLLLFIKRLESRGYILPEFQYNPCYCLSLTPLVYLMGSYVSIQPLLLFIVYHYG